MVALRTEERLDLQILGSLIGIDYYKGLFNEVPMTFRHVSSIIIFMTGLLYWRALQRRTLFPTPQIKTVGEGDY